MIFVFTAIDPSGQTVTGTLEGDSRAEVAGALRTRGWFAVGIERAGADAPTAGGRRHISLQPATGGASEEAAPARLSPAQLELFIRQIARMTEASVPLDRGLAILGASQSDAAGRLALAIRTAMRAGAAPAEAFARFPAAFDATVVALIEAGQVSGQMGRAFAEIEQLVVKRNRLRGQVVSALIYPAILSVVAAASVLTILLFVIPQFEALVSDPSLVLPLPARIVFGLSRWLQSVGWILGPAALVALLLLLRAARGGGLERSVLGVAARLPAVGRLGRLVTVTRFCRTLGSLLVRNVSLLPAVDVAARGEAGEAADRLHQARARLRDGASLSDALAGTELFPHLVLQLTRIGEETGAVGTMLLRSADMLDEDIERSLKQFVILFQPMVLVILGVVIGGLLYGLFSAILAINQTIL